MLRTTSGVTVAAFLVFLSACAAGSSAPGGSSSAAPSAVVTPRAASLAPSQTTMPTGETPQPVPAGNDAAFQFEVGPGGSQPCGITGDGTTVWITDLRRNKVVALDAATNLILTRGQVTNAPCAIVHHDGALFISERSVKFLYKRDAVTLEQLADPLLGPGQIWDVDATSDAVWYVDRDNGQAVHVDPATNTVVARIEVGGPASGLAVSARAIWVASEGTDTTVRIDPATDAVVATIASGDGPVWVAATEDEAWVTHTDGTLVRIDAHTNEVTHRLEIGGQPGEPAVAAGAVWVPNQAGGTLTEIGLTDGVTRRVLTIASGLAVAVAASGDVWVTGYTAGLAWRVTAE